MIPEIVLIEETIKKFGYDPRDFKDWKDRKKTIIRTCFKCHNVYEQKFDNAVISVKKNKKCKYCANKERAINSAEQRSIIMKERVISGEYIPPMLNKHHTEEVKIKARERLIGKSFEDLYGKERADKIKKEASERFSGENNPFYGKHHNEETIEFLRENTRKITKRGKESNFYGKKYWPDRNLFEYNGVKYRSRWEVATAVYFEKNDIKCEYESKIFNLGETTYTPDFYLPDQDKYIEVKGYWYLDAIEKFKDFNTKYPNIIVEIWNEDKLKLLGIL